MARNQLYLVIHHLDHRTSLAQAQIAFASGADGVFLISHHGADSDLFAPAAEIKKAYPQKLVGLNLLGSGAMEALQQVVNLGLDMVWVDNPGVRSDGVTDEAGQIAEWLLEHGGHIQFFGCVAFKYQPVDPNPAGAAAAAARLHMVPTTSGDATGVPPAVEKIRAMREALGPEHSLAIASGITPQNVSEYTPYATHYLVATGVSSDEYHLDQALVDELVAKFEARSAGK